MRIEKTRQTLPTLLLAAAALALCAPAAADPPARVARLAYSTGAVSFAPAGGDDWLPAPLNRPLVSGDRLWTEPGAREEVQIGSAALRLNGASLLTLLNVDDRTMRVQLSQGRMQVRLRRLSRDEVVEIDTPNLALTLRAPGDYRIEVDEQGKATTVMVRSGKAEAYGDGNVYQIEARQSYRFAGTDLRDFGFANAAPADDFERWAAERDRRVERSQSARYVSPELTGYADLDDNGSWRAVPDYGYVWAPTRVPAGWAPYRDGHWSWVEPWGWTWVDDAPWGFAVSHYGRWANLRGGWCWVPGPVAVRPVYAPALVVFVGAASAGPTTAWFPLAPREVYRPSYHASHNYITNINISNTTIKQTQITNIYNNSNNINYVNRRVRGAVVAVPTTAFARAQPVARSAVTLSAQSIASAPLRQSAAVAPQRSGPVAGAPPVHRPDAAALTRHAVARMAPSAAPPLAGRPVPPAPHTAPAPDAAAPARLQAAPSKPMPASPLAAAPQSGAPVAKPPLAMPAPQPAIHPPAPANGRAHENWREAQVNGARPPETAPPHRPLDRTERATQQHPQAEPAPHAEVPHMPPAQAPAQSPLHAQPPHPQPAQQITPSQVPHPQAAPHVAPPRAPHAPHAPAPAPAQYSMHAQPPHPQAVQQAMPPQVQHPQAAPHATPPQAPHVPPAAIAHAAPEQHHAAPDARQHAEPHEGKPAHPAEEKGRHREEGKHE
ncbi:DUF6600 domain-containing protein [Janthinobacterium sp.]|uniref:DUF6600 domain-containing protein n=1 Tax=Janthinobacterium sp. TaxID=1871054 RepID=UPI00293D5CD1|nr:DUF6600 domain-containing protein [Janthinobacterium sp.]